MEISIIIPSRNEGANVEVIVARIERALTPSSNYEILFVDDSDDDTPARLEQLTHNHPQVRFIHRTNAIGLGTAILEGFQMARGDWFIVMDADMQHPPESLPDLIQHIKLNQAEIIIPSRFIAGGHDGGLNVWRKLVSWSARILARVAIRKVLPIKDPTSGYFAVRRDTAFSRPLNPIGWKILLEILARSDYERAIEIPYSFEARDIGSSKFGVKEQWNYLVHLIRLVKSSEEDMRFWNFAAVGLSGVVVNSVVYTVFVKLGVSVVLSFALASAIAMINNFLWNNFLTWKHTKTDRLSYRVLKFYIVSISGLCISSLTVSMVHGLLHWHYTVSGLAGIALATIWNFTLHNKWTFGKSPAMKEQQLHG